MARLCWRRRQPDGCRRDHRRALRLHRDAHRPHDGALRRTLRRAVGGHRPVWAPRHHQRRHRHPRGARRAALSGPGLRPSRGPGPRVPGRPPHRALARPTPAARRRPAGFRWAQLQPQGGAGSAPSRGYLPSEVWTAASYTLHPHFWDLTGEGGTIGNDISLISLPAPSFFPPAALDLGGRFGANLEAMAVGWGERFSTSPAAGLLSTSTSTSENNASTRRGAQGFRVSRLTAPRMRWRRRRSLSPQTRRQPGAARTCTATTGTEGTR